MKKFKYVIALLLVALLFPITTYAAGGVTSNKSSLTITEGSSATFVIKATNAAGKVTVSSSNKSIATVNKSSTWLENASLTVTVKGLKVGSTTVKVVVDAATFDEEVVKKTITIKVNVVEKKSNNNKLSYLKVNPGSINFDANTNSYTIVVDNKVDEITLSAKAQDSKAKVSGTGTKKLNVYANTFPITVTAENGAKRTYTVVVKRKDLEGNDHKLSSNNKLSSLTVKDHNLKFDDSETRFYLDVANDVTNIDITAIPANKYAKVTINKPKQLSPGENTINIVVTAENGDIKTYYLIVTRDDGTPRVTIDELMDTLEETESNTIIVNIRDDNDILTKEMIEKVKETHKKLIINKYIDDKLIYSWILEGKDITNAKSINTLVEFYSSSDKKINELTNFASYKYIKNYLDTSIFKNIELRIYLDDEYNNQSIYGYEYRNQALNKIDNPVEYKENYLEIKNIPTGEYVITQLEISGCVYKTIAIIEFIVILFIFIAALIIFYNEYKKKKKNKRKVKKEETKEES